VPAVRDAHFGTMSVRGSLALKNHAADEPTAATAPRVRIRPPPPESQCQIPCIPHIGGRWAPAASKASSRPVHRLPAGVNLYYSVLCISNANDGANISAARRRFFSLLSS